MFQMLFFDQVGQRWNDEKFYMKYTRDHVKDKKATSKVSNGLIPHSFFCTTFNKKLSFETECKDAIKRDLKKIDVTYELPVGNLTIDATTIFLLPYSDVWQSLD